MADFYAKKTSVYRVGICSSSLSWDHCWHSAWRKKAIHKARHIPKSDNRTKRRCLRISEDLFKQPFHVVFISKKQQIF